MKPWRQVVQIEWQPGVWTLRLECGHVAFRSARYSRQELPRQVLCDGCKSLIGSRVRSPVGKMGTIAGYSGGLFDIEWSNNQSTRWTLDKIREESEIL